MMYEIIGKIFVTVLIIILGIIFVSLLGVLGDIIKEKIEQISDMKRFIFGIIFLIIIFGGLFSFIYIQL